MKTVPQIPQTDNPYELAMHAGNIRYHEQNEFNPRMDAINAAGVVICAEGIVVIGIVILAWVMLWVALP